MMKWSASLAIFILFLNGCASHSAPKDKINISHTTELKEFAGIFKNAGDPEGYLSRIIWGWGDLKLSSNNSKIQHKEVPELIEVSSNEDSLVVKAIKNECVIYKREYIVGRDFEINDGKIVMHKEVSFLTRGAGDPLVGPSYEKIVLGLDVDGHGVYKSQGSYAGLIYLLFPVGWSDVSEIRFERLNATSTYNECTTANKSYERD